MDAEQIWAWVEKGAALAGIGGFLLSAASMIVSARARKHATTAMRTADIARETAVAAHNMVAQQQRVNVTVVLPREPMAQSQPAPRRSPQNRSLSDTSA